MRVQIMSVSWKFEYVGGNLDPTFGADQERSDLPDQEAVGHLCSCATPITFDSTPERSVWQNWRPTRTRPRQEGNQDIDKMTCLDHVATNANSSQCEAQLYMFEDNEAVIQMIIKRRTPMMRHVSRHHRVALDGLFDRINLTEDDETRSDNQNVQISGYLYVGKVFENLRQKLRLSSFTLDAKTIVLIWRASIPRELGYILDYQLRGSQDVFR